MTDTFDVVVIGGGQAGLVTGYFLNQHPVNYVVLDANEQPGGSWQHYYDSLQLYSPAKYGELPGLPFPGDPDHQPTRYEVMDYLQQYEETHSIPVRRGVWVSAVQRQDGWFYLQTPTGERFRAAAVVSASGPFNTPHKPRLPGDSLYQGQTLHSYDYDTPPPYAGQHVVVIGSRDSAMQIAYELSQVARVTMAVRHSLEFIPKRFLGKSIFWWLHDTGYDQLPLGLFTQLTGSKKIIGKEPYQTALAEGNPAVRPMFQRLTETGVIWADGEAEAVDTVLYATGFRPGLGYLAETGGLDESGHARQHNGVSTTVPGLFFVGLFGQRSHASATLRGVGRDAEAIAGKVARYVHENGLRPLPATGD